MILAVGIGAGGHAKVIIDILKMRSDIKIVGLIDSNPELHGKSVMGIPVLGGDELLSGLKAQDITHAFIGVGSVVPDNPRKHLYETLRKHGLKPIHAIHQSAVVSESAHIGEGTVVMANAVINPNASVGVNCIINTGAIVEHDCVIADHVHISTGVKLGGNVVVETGAHVGIGAAVRQGIRIGRSALVGAGAVVVEDVPDNKLVVGVPARIIKNLEAQI